MPELSAAAMARLAHELDESMHRAVALAMARFATAIQAEARRELARTTHTHRTKTPARPGGPPALISGTLRRSVIHTVPVRHGDVWSVRAGVAAGFYPPYGSTRTASSKYGGYLETGLRNGATYPFLAPAFRVVARRDTHIWRDAFRAVGWPHIR